MKLFAFFARPMLHSFGGHSCVLINDNLSSRQQIMSVHKSFGKIKYDPISERSSFKPNWVILQCDREIVRYYQHIFYTLYLKKLQTACWGSHCSLVRGERLLNPEAWKKYDGKIIEFSYSYDGGFHTNSDNGGKHFWLKCWSDKFSIVRESLGLSSSPKISYHISVGSISN